MKRERISSVLPAGLNRLDADRVSSARRASRAANTDAAYGAQWRRFVSWCEDRGAEPAPAAPETAAAYLTELGAVRKIATVKVAAAAIAAFHRAARLAPPTADPVVTEALAGIARRQAADPRCAPRQAPTFTHEDALAMMDAAARRRRSGRGVESARGAAERGRLDRVILALAYCAMLRRSEISALVWDDVEDPGAGLIRIRVRRSKRNQDGAKVDVRAVVGTFAGALRDHRAAADVVRPAGRVVPLGGHQIAKRIAAAGRAVGIDGLTGHSPRRAMATELARRKIDSVAIARAGGWIQRRVREALHERDRAGARRHRDRVRRAGFAGSGFRSGSARRPAPCRCPVSTPAGSAPSVAGRTPRPRDGEAAAPLAGRPLDGCGGPGLDWPRTIF